MAAFNPVPKHTAVTLLDAEALEIVVALQTYCREYEAPEAVDAFRIGLEKALTMDIPNVDPNGEVAA